MAPALNPAPPSFDPGVLARLPKIERLVIDSRLVRPGDVFVAIPGARHDGRQHIAQAIASGARAVIWEKEGFGWPDEWQISHVPISGLRQVLGELASYVYQVRVLPRAKPASSEGRTP